MLVSAIFLCPPLLLFLHISLIRSLFPRHRRVSFHVGRLVAFHLPFLIEHPVQAPPILCRISPIYRSAQICVAPISNPLWETQMEC